MSKMVAAMRYEKKETNVMLIKQKIETVTYLEWLSVRTIEFQ